MLSFYMLGIVYLYFLPLLKIDDTCHLHEPENLRGILHFEPLSQFLLCGNVDLAEEGELVLVFLSDFISCFVHIGGYTHVVIPRILVAGFLLLRTVKQHQHVLVFGHSLRPVTVCEVQQAVELKLFCLELFL